MTAVKHIEVKAMDGGGWTVEVKSRRGIMLWHKTADTIKTLRRALDLAAKVLKGKV